MSVIRVSNVINRLEKLRSEAILRIVEQAIINEQLYIIDLNREQLAAGINSLGNRITPPYTARTVAIKSEKGQPTDKVYLLDTGSWQNGFKVEVYKNKILIVSSDEKDELLQRKYGEEIEGLTDENLAEVRLEMTPFIDSEIRKFLKIS
jgi:hypothetical protein